MMKQRRVAPVRAKMKQILRARARACVCVCVCVGRACVAKGVHEGKDMRRGGGWRQQAARQWQHKHGSDQHCASIVKLQAHAHVHSIGQHVHLGDGSDCGWWTWSSRGGSRGGCRGGGSDSSSSASPRREGMAMACVACEPIVARRFFPEKSRFALL